MRVNRVGIDGYHLKYNGGSKIYSALGEEAASVPDETEGITTATLHLTALHQSEKIFRYGKMQTNSNSAIRDKTNVKNDLKVQQYLEVSS
mgnify:CR=1 FL=1